MERRRFLRAGLVTPLPGGPGIDLAALRPLREVHRLSARRRGSPAPDCGKRGPGWVKAFGRCDKRRGGAPKGERASPSPRPRPEHWPVATSAGVARLQTFAPIGAPPPLVFWRRKVSWRAV